MLALVAVVLFNVEASISLELMFDPVIVLFEMVLLLALVPDMLLPLAWVELRIDPFTTDPVTFELSMVLFCAMLMFMSELLTFESVRLELSTLLLLTVELVRLLFMDASITLKVVKWDTLNVMDGVVVMIVHSELGHVLVLPLSYLSTAAVGVMNGSPSNRIIAVWFMVGNCNV